MTCIILSFPAVLPATDLHLKHSAPVPKKSYKSHQGDISLAGGTATLSLPKTLRFLGPGDAEEVLVKAWGNKSDKNILGMVVPAAVEPWARDGWGVVVGYQDNGHVYDDGAESLNYRSMLAEMKKGMEEVNRSRTASGHERIDLIGWAAKPSYDRKSHTLSWAKELSFGDSGERILNYNVRILGRKGVLILNAVAGMGQFAQVEQNLAEISAAVTFNPGYRYQEFTSTADSVASYGITSLVTGGIAAKTGFIPMIQSIPPAGKILLALLMSVFGGYIMLLLKRRVSHQSSRS